MADVTSTVLDTAKKAFNWKILLGFLFSLLILLVIFDVCGITDKILYPFSSAKAKFDEIKAKRKTGTA